MNFYYRSLPEGRCEVVCTRCFLTVGAAQDTEEIRKVEGRHQCQATGIRAQGPTVSARALSTDPDPRSSATFVTSSQGTADWSMRPMVRNALRLLAAAFMLYLLPSSFEFFALKHASPWISSVLVGDFTGCAFLCVVLRKVRAGICLYCLLTAFEAGAYWLRIMPLSVLFWFTDLVPTLVVSVIVLRSGRHRGKLITFG